jgi:hypothetical protein
MDVGIHLIIGSVLEKFSRKKLWLYAIPAFLSHAYVDIVTVHWEKPLNWFGFLAGSNKSGPMIRWVGFQGFWNVSNIGTLFIILLSIIVWLMFFRNYVIGILFSWVAWDGLWVVQEIAFLLGFHLPLLHIVMINYLTQYPVFFAVHVIMGSFLILIIWHYIQVKRESRNQQINSCST